MDSIFKPPFFSIFTPPLTITKEQARANLEALLDQREERLSIITRLLSEFDIDAQHGFGDEIPLAWFDTLDNWFHEHAHTVADAQELADIHRWEASDFSGADIAYSFLGDVAILLGEIMIHLRPGLKWWIDFSVPSLAKSPNDNFRRPVIHGLAIPDNPIQKADTNIHRHVFGVFEGSVTGHVFSLPIFLTRPLRNRLSYYPMLPTETRKKEDT